MIGDKNLYFANLQAYSSATSSELDMGVFPGHTKRVGIWFEGAGLAAAGSMTVDVQSSSVSGSGHASDALFTYTPAELNEGVFLPLNMDLLNRYVRIVIGGSPSAGTWTCFITAHPQTAR